MSRTRNAPRWGSSTVLAGLIALVASVLTALALAPRADAAFTTGKCAGPNVAGLGASFARDAHIAFSFYFRTGFCLGTPGAGTIDVSYNPAGSGAGRTLMKDRAQAPRFGMTDEPPTSLEIAQMNAGMPTGTPGVDPDPNAADNGLVHVVPAAVGAVAPLVNFPDSCDVTDLPDSAETAEQDREPDGVPDDVIRVRFTKTQFEKIWAKTADADNWTEVFPELTDAGCNKPIIRVVRFDNSGTTFTLKDYLNTINGGRGWLTTFSPASGPLTREWPGATFGDRDDCDDAPNGIAEPSDPDGPGAPGLPGDTDQLTSGCANGNGNLVPKVIAIDGSIGYSDISTARGLGLAITSEANDNDVYWTQVQNGSGSFQEPTADQFGFRTDGAAGSNCGSTTFTSVPASTLASWTSTSGVNSPAGYGICTLTYGLVFDDYADAYGTGAAEEAKARTVKDYWTAVVSDAAQSQLFPKDYAPLPPSILAIARAGVSQIDWNKGAGGGGGGGGTTPPAGGGGSTPPGGGTLPPSTTSNTFSVPRTTISSKTGAASVSVKLPGAGKLELVGSAKPGKKRIRVGRVVLTASRAGTFKLTLKPSAAAKKVLRKKGKLKVTLKLTFSPNGGTAKSSTRTITLKLSKPKR